MDNLAVHVTFQHILRYFYSGAGIPDSDVLLAIPERILLTTMITSISRSENLTCQKIYIVIQQSFLSSLIAATILDHATAEIGSEMPKPESKAVPKDL